MPLYEIIILAKCAQPKATANMARNVSLSIIQNGGNVRDVKILADRVLPKMVMANDKKKYMVGRYLQVLFDGSLECKQQAIKKARQSYETMKVDVFRLNNFYTQTQQYAKEASESMIKDVDAEREALVEKIKKATA